MSSRFCRWVAVLVVLLLPFSSMGTTLAALAHHSCCEGARVTAMQVNDSNDCPDHADAESGAPSCSSHSSDDGAPTTQSGHTCSSCVGASGASLALARVDPPSTVPPAVFVAVPAGPAYLPAPPPSRLERPPRAFSV